jgi:hypothetical protein
MKKHPHHEAVILWTHGIPLLVSHNNEEWEAFHGNWQAVKEDATFKVRPPVFQGRELPTPVYFSRDIPTDGRLWIRYMHRDNDAPSPVLSEVARDIRFSPRNLAQFHEHVLNGGALLYNRRTDVLIVISAVQAMLTGTDWDPTDMVKELVDADSDDEDDED